MAVKVKVTVTQTAGKLAIDVDQEPIRLAGLGPVDIFWKVKPSAWKFTEDARGDSTGITIKNLVANRFVDHKGRDDQGNPSKNDHKWQRTQSDGNAYSYTISVTDGKNTIIWDPTIMND